MAFTATIVSITAGDSAGSDVKFFVGVRFDDSVTQWTTTKTYTFPLNITQQAAVNTIKADGTVFKNALATIGELQDKVGTVINI